MKRELKEEMFDVMLRSALREYTQTLAEELDETEIPPHQFSPEFERKMEKLLKKMRRKEWRQAHRKIAQRAVAVLAVVCLSGSVLVTQVDAIRVPVVSFVITMKEKFSEITFEETETHQGVSEEFMPYLPAYIPEGFALDTVEETQKGIRALYDREDGLFYSVTCESEVQKGAFDTENAEVSEIKIQGTPAVLIEKMDDGDPYTQIVWATGNGGYHLSGYLSGEEAVRILESVKNIF